jgi:hypothetical protein
MEAADQPEQNSEMTAYPFSLRQRIACLVAGVALEVLGVDSLVHDRILQGGAINVVFGTTFIFNAKFGVWRSANQAHRFDAITRDSRGEDGQPL